MKIIFWLSIHSLLHYAQTTDQCDSMHVKSHGLDLTCCSLKEPLLPTCEYSSFCRFDECSCHLTLRHDFDCIVNNTVNEPPFLWRDHVVNPKLLPCLQPNFPNRDSAYQLNVLSWKQNKTELLMKGMCQMNVTAISFHELSSEFSSFNFLRCMTNILSLEILLKKSQKVDLSGFERLQKLSSLRLVNVDFELWTKKSPWTQMVSYIHIENSSLSTLPQWLSLSPNLQRIFIKKTQVTTISTISRLLQLKSAKLSSNKINDLNKIILNNKQLYDLDLSYNEISSISSFSFANCNELRILDLSYNPLENLPYKPFFKNSKLKWLKLDGTRIRSLSTDHFAGLSSLKTLSLSKTPLQSIAPFSFLPLKSLKMLNLEATNLTKVPSAVTQNCGLTHLNIANNFLHRNSSLPPEIMVMLSSLSQLQLDGNPLTEFPPALLLLSKDNSRLYRQLIQSMTALPVWLKEPCTPYFWYLHLGNKSAFRQLLQPWNTTQMQQKSMNYCKKQYEYMLDQTQIYKELENNSACSVSRKLRSAIINKNTLQTCNGTKVVTPKCLIVEKEKTGSSPLILITSLFANMFLLFLLFIMTVAHCSKRKSNTY